MKDAVYVIGIFPPIADASSADASNPEASKKVWTDLQSSKHARPYLISRSVPPPQARFSTDFVSLQIADESILVVETDSAHAHEILEKLLHEGSAAVFRLRVDQNVCPAHAANGVRKDALARLQAIEGSLDTWRANLMDALRLDHSLTTAAEWLLDNTYLVRTEIAEVRRHLPANYLDLIGGDLEESRVYRLSQAFRTQKDNAVDAASMRAYLEECQAGNPFSLAELWLFPLFVRVGLIETVAQLAVRTTDVQDLREAAYFWANRLAVAARQGPDALTRILNAMELPRYASDPLFATVVAEQLQEEESALTAVQRWVEEHLHASVAELVRQEHHREANERLSIANAFSSLRIISRIDYREIFEATSAVEAELHTDPGGVYQRSDFITRDRCRRMVERIARNASLEEIKVAQMCVRLAADTADPRANHVAYYLLSDGLTELEDLTRAKVPAQARIARTLRAHATAFYLASVAGLTACLLILSLMLAWDYGVHRLGVLIAMGLLALFPLSELTIQIVNALIISLLPPEPLAKLDFRHGIPAENATLVVVPMMLTGEEAIRREVEKLEVRYLANRDPRLSFALLSDFVDAPAANTPHDEAVLEVARRGIEELRTRYPETEFLLFHRPRVWSNSEHCWMGRERKRGKIEELNDYLCGDPSARGPLVGSLPNQIRFVITLDSDTQLPPESACRMIETISHPLNRPELDPETRTCSRGYAVIQPRVSIALPGATATRFTRIFADTAGTDPYSQSVSDAHQDLFGEATFHGKAIYDVQAFREATSNRFPAETILSHDLIEGAHAGVGLASDIELFENLPLDYSSYIKREHRWIRGDWQIAPWIFPRVPGPSGHAVPNPLSLISRWRILDNLRRSLVSPASILLLLLGWFLSPAPGVWSLVIAFAIVIPALAPLLDRLAHRIRGTVLRWQGAEGELVRAVVSVAFLPHQAWISVDAIFRATYRRLVSRHLLLEWQAADATDAELHHDATFRQMLIIAIVSTVVLSAQYLLHRLAPATVFVGLWMLAPGLLRFLAAPASPESTRHLDGAERRFLRHSARRTWRFFDDLVGPESNWLPPDNSQLALRIEVAQRTSPTNIGLWLTSALAAVDMGYLTVDEFLRRCEFTMATISQLERYEGHLLNWYDTKHLTPLLPRYVSTVDSGNFLASLWVVQQSCKEMVREPVVGTTCLRGLHDVLSIIQETANQGARRDQSDQPAVRALRRSLRGNVESHQILDRLLLASSALQQVMDARRWQPTGDEESYWISRMTAELTQWTALATKYLSWVRTLAQPPDSALSDLSEDAIRLRRKALRSEICLEDLVNDNRPPSLQAMEALLALPEPSSLPAPLSAWLKQLRGEYANARAAAKETSTRLQNLAAHCGQVAADIKMGLLYDRDRRLFGIGYALGDPVRFTSHYDLLASECRLASLVAIAKGDVPVEHWFALGRPRATASHGKQVLLSWGGTMFEYLMPLVFTRTYDNSLLDYACQGAVREQAEFGAQNDLPWGISESAFSALDANQFYQYRAFGVPRLALKAGLEDDLVVAPYATMLALLVDPRRAVANLHQLERLQLNGPMGFYEAIDFRFDDSQDNEPGVTVYTYMAHHQGMSLVALDNVLHRNLMQERFHRVVSIRAIESVLYERIPITPPAATTSEPQLPAKQRPNLFPSERTWKEETAVPRAHIYGNGKYTVMLTNAGGGFSRWNQFDVSRWHSDPALDDWGTFLFIRDLRTNQVWSACHQPLVNEPASGSASFFADHALYERRSGDIETKLTITVAPEDDVEIRRLTIANQSQRSRTLEFTSYLELAMATHAADSAHPAFSKMFVQTEQLDDTALIAHRRLRSPEEPPVWTAHVLLGAPSNSEGDAPEYETDRARFLGRDTSLASARALTRGLSGTTGTVIDPIFSLRCRSVIEPRERCELVFLTCAAASREALVELVAKYRSIEAAARAFELARTRSELEFRYLGIDSSSAHRFQEFAGYVLFPHFRMRAAEERIIQNRLGQTSLWAYGISGDLPIVAVTIGEPRQLSLLREVLLAHTYWRLRGFKVDLVVLNLEGSGYDRPLYHQLSRLIEAHSSETGTDKPGGVFLRDWFSMTEEQRNLMLSSAVVVLHGWRGPLQRQLPLLGPDRPSEISAAEVSTAGVGRQAEEPSAPLPFLELPYFNGIGGFTRDTREYAIYLAPGVTTPAPWSNVMAHSSFGTLVTESGLGCTWNRNSQANRLTQWTNDPVIDQAREIIYLRDDETGAIWTPTAQPIRGPNAYRARHGQGYTLYEHNRHAIEQELTVFVPVNNGLEKNGVGDPIKICRLRLRNGSSRVRKITVTYFAEWVLGTTREDQQLHVRSWRDEASGALLATQTWNCAFAEQIAFAAMNPRASAYSGDRTQFLGRNGSYERPRGLREARLDNRVAAALDPAAVLQLSLTIQPGQTQEVCCFLGQVEDADAVAPLLARFDESERVEAALRATREWWDSVLGTLQVETPTLSTNLLLNRWLMYQTLSCRFFGRTGLYQSSGAFGYRDQLQDSLAFVYARPALTRQHILAAAARQFPEGDVQHWWHPETGNGVRSRCSDDLLWLPFVTAQYVRVTGDRDILNQQVSFVEGDPLKPNELERVFVPEISKITAPLWEHCRLALEHAWTAGPHSLPLIGTGDWNDGLNNVGREGRGESVWLAWFLCDTAESFASIIQQEHSDTAHSLRLRTVKLRESIEEHCWDGDWYLRGFFDDGTALGSRANAEARLDSIAQSWAVLSGAGDHRRGRKAMEAAQRYLVDQRNRLVLLFAPPFDHTSPHPGYVMGYPPGLRENGGQYTHGSLWMAAAWAELGEADAAVQLLQLMNPIEASRDPQSLARYRGEPYVMPGDVYSAPGHVGQSGWTWYTGSSAWMYRIWIEHVLGFKLRGDRLSLEPVIPTSWLGFAIRYRYRSATYEIAVNRRDVQKPVLFVDGTELPSGIIQLRDDGDVHKVALSLPRSAVHPESAPADLSALSR